MEWMPVPTDQILETATQIAERTHDDHLIDCITVTRGYLELQRMYPTNRVFQTKSRGAVQMLAAELGGLTLAWSLN